MMSPHPTPPCPDIPVHSPKDSWHQMGSHQVLYPRGGKEVEGEGPQGIDSWMLLGLQASHLAPSTWGTIPHASSLTLGSPFAPGQLIKPGWFPSFPPITISRNKRTPAMTDPYLYMGSTVFSYVQVLTPYSSECDLIWRWVL